MVMFLALEALALEALALVVVQMEDQFPRIVVLEDEQQEVGDVVGHSEVDSDASRNGNRVR